MMANDDNVDKKFCVEQMGEQEKGIKEVENLLRGRLIAERSASKLANQEVDQLEQRLGKLETQLKAEIKSKKRAEKKLKLLIKKLSLLKIPYSPEDSDKGDISSVSSSISSSLTQVEEKDGKGQIKIQENGEVEGYEKMSKCRTGYKDFEDNVSQSSKLNHNQICNHAEVDNQRLSTLLSSVGKEDKDEQETDQKGDESQRNPIIEEKSNTERAKTENSKGSNRKTDDKSSTDTVEEKKDGELKCSEAQDDSVDMSLALVLVDSPKEPLQKRINAAVLDENVKQVLHALSLAKQKLLSSMERRHVHKVGSRVI